jgi:hypothetical protein
MVVHARMHLVRRQRTVAPSAPAVTAQQVVDLASRLPAPPPVEHDLAPAARPRLDRGVFSTLACLLTGSARLALKDLGKRLRKGEVGTRRSGPQG